jgi:GNAT superfamily N-acetyltransferase
MIDRQKLIECEIRFPAEFSDLTVHPFGLLFCDPDNPHSHDSNHAVLLNPGSDPEPAIAAIIAFYQQRGIPPMIYPSFQPGELGSLAPALERLGFRITIFDVIYMFRKAPSRITPIPELEVKRLAAVCPALEELIFSENPFDQWTAPRLRRHLASDRFHLLAGFVDGHLATVASLNLLDGHSRVDDLLTHRIFQGQGYGRSLLHHLIAYHDRISANLLYLYAANSAAIRTYRDAGFAELPKQLPGWSARMEPSNLIYMCRNKL